MCYRRKRQQREESEKESQGGFPGLRTSKPRSQIQKENKSYTGCGVGETRHRRQGHRPASRERGWGSRKTRASSDCMGAGRRPGGPAEPLIEQRPVGTDQPEPADFR